MKPNNSVSVKPNNRSPIMVAIHIGSNRTSSGRTKPFIEEVYVKQWCWCPFLLVNEHVIIQSSTRENVVRNPPFFFSLLFKSFGWTFCFQRIFRLTKSFTINYTGGCFHSWFGLQLHSILRIYFKWLQKLVQFGFKFNSCSGYNLRSKFNLSWDLREINFFIWFIF